MITQQLVHIMPNCVGRAATFWGPLTKAMAEFDMNNSGRQAAFLAQVAHESGELRYTAEIGAGYEYEGREDLGNTQAGDGPKFKGRGLLQVTGRANYLKCAQALGVPLLEHPELLESPELAARAAGWFWKSYGLNPLADVDRFGEITRKINGGYNGLDQRISFWLRARKEFGL